MTTAELLEYRKKIIDDAIRLKKPDRTPRFANFWTWKILDSGYKLSEALHDWKKIEEATINFAKKYPFDMVVDDGVRNPRLVISAIGEPAYEIDDEAEIMNIRDASYMDPEHYDLLIEDYARLLWEVAVPRRAKGFNSEMTMEQLHEAFRQFGLMGLTMQNIARRLAEECGVVQGLMSGGTLLLGFELLFNFLRGMQGVAFDLRRCPDKLKAACEAIERMMLEPQLAAIKNKTYRPGPNAAVHTCTALLGHTIVNQKQFEKYYWPTLKKTIDAVVEADMTLYVFSEGSTKRFWEYFKEIPAGHVAFHVEQDDIFEFKKALPNCCAVGGMPASLLGNGTREQCVSYAKHLIDELGGEGFILSQDKMISYRHDANPENLKAVCEFVLEYRS